MEAAARSTTIPWFQAKMKKLQDLSRPAFEWLSRLDPMQWCRSHFRTHSKCGILLNNMCEAFNKSILDVRDKLIITLLERIRREAMEKWAHDVGPRVFATLEKLKKQLAWCIPRLAGESNMSDVCWPGTITKAKEDGTSRQQINSENYMTIKAETSIIFYTIKAKTIRPIITKHLLSLTKLLNHLTIQLKHLKHLCLTKLLNHLKHLSLNNHLKHLSLNKPMKLLSLNKPLKLLSLNKRLKQLCFNNPPSLKNQIRLGLYKLPHKGKLGLSLQLRGKPSWQIEKLLKVSRISGAYKSV
ncbi:uncharacterized protein Pyn_40488 [Prunus yedoensis var. nudiflora]|uniref:Uncharacterized protein n=1 Tax=Prunus yedoensis var. nudiflora TaxID=2094558 RepID=A0A314Y806_PRUYE|nr:uncharacterized protein Pyn_40488 [Prunus yedoensis var. nudiflora]